MKSAQRFFRCVFWAVVTAAIAWIVKKAFQRAAGTQQRQSAHGRVQPDVATQRPKPLVRDPVCGTYVAEDISYSLTQDGESLHFCSRDCAEKYRLAESSSYRALKMNASRPPRRAGG
jgi:YHS domain-containing protein